MKYSPRILLVIISLLVLCLPCFPAVAKQTKGTRVTPKTKPAATVTVSKDTLLDFLIIVDTTVHSDTVSADTLEFDSLSRSAAKTNADTVKTDSTLHLQKKTEPVQNPWHSPYIGIGVGFSLGSDDLFSTWETALPDSARAFLALRISRKFTMAVKEPPTPYNLIFPVSFNMGIVSDSVHSIVIDLPVSFHAKQFNATFAADSLPYRIQLYHSLNMVSASIGILWYQAIPKEYFAISGGTQSAVFGGIYACPLQWGYQTREINFSVAPDSLGTAIGVAMNTQIPTANFFGAGLSWKAGLSTRSLLASGDGLEAGVAYRGQWNIRAVSSTGVTIWSDLLFGPTNRYESLSYSTHRIEIYATLIKNRSPKATTAKTTKKSGWTVPH